MKTLNDQLSHQETISVGCININSGCIGRLLCKQFPVWDVGYSFPETS